MTESESKSETETPTADPDTNRQPLVDSESDADAENADLASSLTSLSQLSSGLGLVDLLTRVATYAVQAIPGADGAGLTLLEPDRADLIVKSEPFVRDIDDIQYSIGEGRASAPPRRPAPCDPGRSAVTRGGRISGRAPAGSGCILCCRCR